MVHTKSWFHSKTVWGALVAFAAGIAGGSGIDPHTLSYKEVSDLLLQIIGVMGALVAIFGRLSATHEIR